MNGQKMLEMALANLPLVLSVLAALGMWKLGAALIRKVVGEARRLAAGTKTKIDDEIVAVVGAQLEEVAKLLEGGNVDEAKRKLGIVQLQAKAVKGLIK